MLGFGGISIEELLKCEKCEKKDRCPLYGKGLDLPPGLEFLHGLSGGREHLGGGISLEHLLRSLAPDAEVIGIGSIGLGGIEDLDEEFDGGFPQLLESLAFLASIGFANSMEERKPKVPEKFVYYRDSGNFKDISVAYSPGEDLVHLLRKTDEGFWARIVQLEQPVDLEQLDWRPENVKNAAKKYNRQEENAPLLAIWGDGATVMFVHYHMYLRKCKLLGNINGKNFYLSHDGKKVLTGRYVKDIGEQFFISNNQDAVRDAVHKFNAEQGPNPEFLARAEGTGVTVWRVSK